MSHFSPEFLSIIATSAQHELEEFHVLMLCNPRSLRVIISSLPADQPCAYWLLLLQLTDYTSE